MTELPIPKPLPECDGLAHGTLETMRSAGQPVVIRGLVADWPSVRNARTSNQALADYLAAFSGDRAVRAIAAPPSEAGRFFYDTHMAKMNFQSGRGPFATFLGDLLLAGEMVDAPAMAIQSELVSDLLPGFCEENALDALSQAGVKTDPRIWIANQSRVEPHYDIKENLACCIAGRRHFTIFPPDQIGNLYPGPFEMTPAGNPVSMVDLDVPDLVRFPRFAEALKTAQSATLDPGDAIYIPYCWWHGVKGLEAFNVLVNYWWNDAPSSASHPYDALLHAILTFRDLPHEQREIWRMMLDHYVFEEGVSASDHLPDARKGVMGPMTDALAVQIKEMLGQSLKR